MKSIITFLTVFLLCSIITSADNDIFIDGRFGDWDDIDAAYSDPVGDGSDAGVDFGDIKVRDCDRFLYIYFEVNSEISLQNTENIRLYIDTDNNNETGKKINEIGADLIWNFKEKTGDFYADNKIETEHHDIGIFPSPTITSDKFEIAIEKSRQISGKPVFPDDEIRIVLKDMFDTAPDDSFVTYSFTDDERDYSEVRFEKPDYSDIRLVSYNILFDNPFKEKSADAFARIFNSLDADIYLLQEMYDHTAEEVEELIYKISDTTFYVEKLERDIIYIGKYPLLDKFQLDGSGAFYIKTEHHNAGEMLIINAHLKCCDYDYVRLKQTNQIMNYIDLLKKGRQIRNNTPIVIAGDMNFVGNGEQLDMMLNGNNKGMPDWDNTPFTDAIITVPNMPVNFTWYDMESNYAPGRLDFVIYSDSVMKIANNFVLYTSTMSKDNLEKLGLKKDDSLISSDHLPLVIDFILR